MTPPRKILWLVVLAGTFLLLPMRTPAQSGTVIDDVFAY